VVALITLDPGSGVVLTELPPPAPGGLDLSADLEVATLNVARSRLFRRRPRRRCCPQASARWRWCAGGCAPEAFPHGPQTQKRNAAPGARLGGQARELSQYAVL
jgi:hypothetical protein